MVRHRRQFSWRLRPRPSTHIRIFLNPQLFPSGYYFRPHVSGESGIRIRNFLNPLSSVEIILIRYESGIAWTLNPDIFLSCKVTRSSHPVVYRKYCIQDGNLVPRFPLLPVFTKHALLPIFPEKSWVL